MQKRKIDSKGEEKSLTITQQSGPYSSNGHQIKNTRGFTRRKREVITPISIFGSHNNLILDKSSLEIDSILNKGLLEHGTVEDIIRDIFPFVEKYIPINDDIFSEDTTPIEFLDWMVSSYDKVDDSEEWSIIFSSGESKYYLQSVYEFKGIESRGYSVELDFLPILSKKNRNLHDLFVGLLGLFKSELGSPFFFDEDEFEYAIEQLQSDLDDEDSEENDEDVNRLKDYLMIYTSGDAKIIKDEVNSSGMTIESLKEAIGKFKSEYNTEKICIKFIKKSIKLFDFNENFNDYIHVLDSEMEEGFPISPLDYAKFDWNFDEDNPIFSHKQMIVNSTWGEYGDIPFRYSVINNNKKKPSNFIKEYLKMMSEICDLSYLIKNQGA